ncbi:phosphatidylglycerol lysyltransferase domain-containing protein [Dyadobacter luticola]|uniref:Phosphatidylglycerol lysyltransferase n=1 Tax=Dyadobacter luticola TaxID=1979387 RepID=A0A5R9L544_9BACT|nr:phosphatidylglycerol lysyltransferase domain-containing protein [Dyadobacter luticola]TLV03702.1 lysylphosphatidylglycerol synthetase family protein [Dyadobacter luticola]
MKKAFHALSLIRRNGMQYLRENARIIGQFIFTVFFIALGIWFFHHQETELHQVRQTLSASGWQWLGLGILLTVVYIILQGFMYVGSFAATGSNVTLGDSVILFLKRNFVSVFLPAGGISSLAFFTASIEKKGISKSQIHFASSVYAFVGILSVVIVAIPVFVWAIIRGSIGAGEWAALLSVSILIALLFLLYKSIASQGYVYRKLLDRFPSLVSFLNDLSSNKIDKKHFIQVTWYSVLIELTGIAHIYIAMVALHQQPSLPAAALAYITAVIFLIVSPFLRGLGAVEVSMSYMLTRFGYSDAAALSITLFYRFLEFWLPLLAGAASFLLHINKLLMRVFPALLLLLLGIVNIISVLTPAIAHRLRFLEHFLPLDAMTVSNYFVLIAGLFLLVTAAFMLKGLRMAWYFAMALCGISVVGNLTKAVDYEEAIFSVAVAVILYISRKEYYIRNSRRLGIVGVQTTLLSCLAVLVYGFVGFYFLDQKHFGIEFSWKESIRYTFQQFFLLGSGGMVARDPFARHFLYSINVGGVASIAFLTYTLVRPHFLKLTQEEEDLKWAKGQIEKYGHSALDYFKAYPDKLIFREENGDAFLSYRIAGSFAVVLESPVGPSESLRNCIAAFDRYCFQRGLKSCYYRVPEEDLFLFPKKGKLFLGQEGVVDLTGFSLEGGARKSIRNALKKISEKGFHAKIYKAPLEDVVLDVLQEVSDEWLADTGRSEIVFSQGMFVTEELRHQTIVTVESDVGRIVAFLNIIPDYAQGEATYDLIRKTKDAPNGVIDFLMVEMFLYLKKQGYNAVNLGFAPLSGIADPRNFPERSMKFAYEKIRTFSHYKGLRDYKEKFSPVWHNKYLIYDQDYDLFKIPAALAKVIKP